MVGIAGIDKPEYRRYRRRPPRGSDMVGEFEKTCGPQISASEAKPGDVFVAWRNWRTHRAEHCGFLSYEGRIIHTYDEQRGCSEHIMDEAWGGRMLAFFRMPGVVD
jgi:cell wall-associated NlpC family hydrolase